MSSDAWRRILASPPPDLVLVHEVGNAEAPDSEGGRIELVARMDGALRVIRTQRRETRRWSARCAPEVVRALLDGFAAVGFPDVPWHEIPPGPSVRVLGAWFGEAGRGEGAETICARTPLERDPTFARLFALCDGIAARVAEGETYITDPPAQGEQTWG